jgi:hypothetical protein
MKKIFTWGFSSITEENIYVRYSSMTEENIYVRYSFVTEECTLIAVISGGFVVVIVCLQQLL